jgi:hypothetical protein
MKEILTSDFHDDITKYAEISFSTAELWGTGHRLPVFSRNPEQSSGPRTQR